MGFGDILKILEVGGENILLILEVLGVFWSFFGFWRYFGLFWGFEGILVIFWSFEDILDI